MRRVAKLITAAVVLSILLSCGVAAQTDSTSRKTGGLKGQIVDAQTRSPLSGASLLILGSQQGTGADADGHFSLKDVPVGSCKVKFSSIGYETLVKTDVIVRSGRATYLQVELSPRPLETQGVVVQADYFPETPAEPTGSTAFNGEEVRRSAGAGGDVSRIVSILPSVAKTNDQSNCLAVRGGSPAENSFYLDNIEIPNINHYPLQGSSGGPIGLLNNDFIQDVSFSAGGFSAIYGDRLSSVTDITFREGDRDQFDAQLEMGLAGLGAVAEGPIARKKGSWMLSIRRSYLDLLVDAIGTGVAPRYSDYQGKVVYNLSPRHKVEVLGVAGVDFIDFSKSQAKDQGNEAYGSYKGYEYAMGANWQFLWNKQGYSETSVSILGDRMDSKFRETKSDLLLSDGNNKQQSYQFRNVNHYRLNDAAYTEFGVEGKHVVSHRNFYYGEYTNSLGDTIPAGRTDDRIESSKEAAFADLTLTPLPRFSTTMGLRYDRFEYNKHSHLSPRLAFSLKLNPQTSLNASTGVYYQNLPLAVLTQSEDSQKLKDPVAYHFVLGLTRLLSENTRLTVEGYYKKNDHYPLDPAQPQLFIVDLFAAGRSFTVINGLVDRGRAESYGIELTLQKKLVRGVYGIACGSYSKSRYEGLDGIWRNRDYDNRFIFGVEGGYKPNNKWEFSLRWVYAGGPPYTPLDIDASAAINRSVLDKNRVNELRYPAYHSLNLRVDRRYTFSHTNLVTYLAIWNAYNRKNVSNYYWNEVDRKPDTIYQWTLLPVAGIEFEF